MRECVPWAGLYMGILLMKVHAARLQFAKILLWKTINTSAKRSMLLPYHGYTATAALLR